MYYLFKDVGSTNDQEYGECTGRSIGLKKDSATTAKGRKRINGMKIQEGMKQLTRHGTPPADDICVAELSMVQQK